METILVLSGVTTHAMAERFPFRAGQIVDSVADLVEQIEPLSSATADATDV
jgi:ribonucleotide monophosphatase NagD (HAD superfamily)